MVGCMLESALGLHASAHVVAGLGGFAYVDLDGNTGMTEGVGGPEPSPVIEPSGPGHGIEPRVDWEDG
jgi:L-alanine-DL-glutamate epimerase-like enolase superfamily enzyme